MGRSLSNLLPVSIHLYFFCSGIGRFGGCSANDPSPGHCQAQQRSWSRLHVGSNFSLEEAATALAASKRNLARRLQEVLGQSPLSDFQDLRIQRAVHLLKARIDKSWNDEAVTRNGSTSRKDLP